MPLPDLESVSHVPFAGRRGRGVRIAVIDSGVHAQHPHIDATRLEPGIAVALDGQIIDERDATLDRLGHGTAVAAAIQEKAPEATCLPIRVFRDSLNTSAAALIAALRWAIEQEVDLINLSLGATNAAHRPHFERAAALARAQGILIVAAREADGVPCYPGSLATVLGVGLDWDCPREQFRRTQENGEWRLLASGYPRPIPGVPQRRNLYGISFAVAQMTGFAARACEAARGASPDDRVEHILCAMLAASEADHRSGALAPLSAPI